MINTVTLNPAIDRILYLQKYIKGTNNRIQRVQNTVGGKGTHVSMNLTLMNQRSRAFGIAYGQTGRYIMDMLREWGVDVRFTYRADAESRTNYLLVEKDGTSTLVSERGTDATDADTEALLQCMKNTLERGDILVFSGDASNYPDPDIYLRLMRELSDRQLRFAVDASGNTLKKSLSRPLYFIKPNEDELSQLMGVPMDNEEQVVQAIGELSKTCFVEIISVSLGKRGALIKAGDGVYRALPPDINIRNTIGCGDCFLAGLLSELERGSSVADALRYATAVSAAAAESELSVGFDKNRVGELFQLSKIEKLL